MSSQRLSIHTRTSSRHKWSHMALQKNKKSAPMKVRKVVKANTTVVGAGATEVKKTSKSVHVYAVGRRKVASARVRLFVGGSGITVNGKPSAEYFKTVDPSG